MNRAGPIPVAARRLLTWLAIGWLALGTAAGGEPAAYLRSITAPDGRISLEVVARQLISPNADQPPIWLVGVVHLGRPDYYRELQAFLDRQGLVLFEGIGAGASGFESPVDEFSLQQALARALNLVFQLDAIDYTRPNFKNSDLDHAGLAALFGGEPGRSTGVGASPGAPGGAEFGLLMQIMEGRGLLGGLARLSVAAVASSPRLQTVVQVLLIEMLGSLPADLAQLSGLPPGTQRLLQALIDERNLVVLRDLESHLQGSSPPDSIAIFYGAGHMAHLETRLRQDLDYQPGAEHWFTALSVNPAQAGLSRFELAMTRTLVRLQLQSLAPTDPTPPASPQAVPPADTDPETPSADSDPDSL